MRTLFAAAVLAAFSLNAYAAPVTWTLDGVTFDDGGTATGSFVFDQSTFTFSDVAISVTAGSNSSFSNETYDQYSTGPSVIYYDPVTGDPLPDGAIFQVGDNVGFDYEGPALAMLFNGPISDSGGTIDIIIGSYSRERDAFPFSSDERYITAGSITSGSVSTVPVPAAVWLFGSALAGLGWVRRKPTA